MLVSFTFENWNPCASFDHPQFWGGAAQAWSIEDRLVLSTKHSVHSFFSSPSYLTGDLGTFYDPPDRTSIITMLTSELPGKDISFDLMSVSSSASSSSSSPVWSLGTGANPISWADTAFNSFPYPLTTQDITENDDDDEDVIPAAEKTINNNFILEIIFQKSK